MPLFGWALLLLVANYAINYFLVQQPAVKPTAEDQIDFPQADENTPQAVLFGDGWTTGYQTVWHGNIRTKKISAGGKK